MKKLQHKYKWQGRGRHLKAKNQEKILIEYIDKYSPVFGWNVVSGLCLLRKILPLSDETFKDILEQLEYQIQHSDTSWRLRCHWTEEEIKSIKNL